MAATNFTWRTHPFEVGQTYVALQSASAMPSGTFVVDGRYELRHIGHSHYDGASIFQFTEAGTGRELGWWWQDDEDDLAWQRVFKATENDI